MSEFSGAGPVEASSDTGMVGVPSPPGWYQALGDVPGTVRYWDGDQWIGDPTYPGPAYSPTVSIGLSATTSVLFGIVAVLSVISAFLTFREVSRFRAWQDGGFADDDTLDALNAAEEASAAAIGVAIWAGFAVLVLSIIWLHRATTAADRFGATGRAWSPAWAVGGWFIPIVNAVIPKLVLHEVERISSTESGDPPVGDRWRKSKLRTDGWIWWLTMLVGTLLVIIGLGVAGDQYNPASGAFNADSHTNGLYTYAIGYLFLACSGGAGAVTIRRLGSQLNRPLGPTSASADLQGAPAVHTPPAPPAGWVAGFPGPASEPKRRSNWWWLLVVLGLIPLGFIAAGFHEACCTHDLLEADFNTDAGPFLIGENDDFIADLHQGTYRLTAKNDSERSTWTYAWFARPTTTVLTELTVVEPGSGDVGVACFDQAAAVTQSGFAFIIGEGRAWLVDLRSWNRSDPQLTGPGLRAAQTEAALASVAFEGLRPGQRIGISCALGDLEAHVDGALVMTASYGGGGLLSTNSMRFNRSGFFFDPAHADDAVRIDDVDAHLP